MKSVDIKQLAFICTLIECQSLTETARRTQVTPSAASQTLSRLRELMDDPLFVREHSNYVPTPFLKSSLGRLREMVDLWEDITEPHAFDPALSDAHMVIACADTFGEVGLADFYQRVTGAAPHMTLDIHSAASGPEDLRDLREGRVELVCGTWEPPPDARDICVETVRHLCLTHCCLNTDHPRLGQTMSLSQYLAEEHILVAPLRRSHTHNDRVDSELQQIDLAARMKTVVNSWALCAELLARTDRLATVSYAQAEMLMRSSPRIKAIALPAGFAWPSMPINIIWQERTHNSKPHRWLRAQLAQALRNIRGLSANPPAPARPLRPAMSLVAAR